MRTTTGKAELSAILKVTYSPMDQNMSSQRDRIADSTKFAQYASDLTNKAIISN